jgi:hypothetical protein
MIKFEHQKVPRLPKLVIEIHDNADLAEIMESYSVFLKALGYTEKELKDAFKKESQ